MTSANNFERFIINLRIFWNGYSRNKAALVGLAIVSSFAIMAIFAGTIDPNPPLRVAVGPAFNPPDLAFPMGTDNLGRDILSGVLYGSRTSILIGVTAALISGTLGAGIGMIAGYSGGSVESLLMRITDSFMVIPSFFLIIVVAAFFGGSTLNVIIVIGVLSWPVNARLIRSEFLSLKERPYVEAARAIGETPTWITIHEILPNGLASLIVNTSLQVGEAILISAGLNFLGLGSQNVASWGLMLYDAQSFLQTAWWMAFFPGIALFLLVLGINLVGDGLNDALNPRISGV